MQTRSFVMCAERILARLVRSTSSAFVGRPNHVGDCAAGRLLAHCRKLSRVVPSGTTMASLCSSPSTRMWSGSKLQARKKDDRMLRENKKSEDKPKTE